MKKKMKRLYAAAASLAIAAGSGTISDAKFNSDAAYGNGGNGSATMEYLDRGICAINTGNGMMISWRCLATDPNDAVYKLYRDNSLIYTSDNGKATCFLDNGGSASSNYKVETLSGSTVLSTANCLMRSNQSYFDIPLDIPKGGSDYTYSANDCSVGDVDGDGKYEIFVKWDPSNAQDNSNPGYTGNVYIDCYTLSGQKLWRVDLGRNIRAGAHYTQFLVADFDLDGKAEMTCKTADGTVDGTGKVIGNGNADYRNSSGYILSGPEYYTLFDGQTGAALDTVSYPYPRETVSKSTWGDDYGNRCDRYLGAVCYLDGVHPSAVSVRGYYTRMTAVAYDVVNKKLVKRWGYDTGYAASKGTGYGNGNHNCMPADVDNDGRQELVLGATCLDDNGKVLWCNNLGHGDAMHLSDFIPEREGLELWVCHEASPYGVSLLDAKNGSTIFHYNHSKDTGRCCAGNIYAGNSGSEFWGAQSGDVYDQYGKSTGVARPGMNFLIYWDGDLEREILDGNVISTINSNKQIETLLTANGCSSNNGTKATPNLSADILGDWREELLLRTDDSRYLRVFCTPYNTDARITTLMHDTQYRTQVAGEQNCYNQPAHPSFFLGTGYTLPSKPDIKLNNTPPEPINGKYIKNLNVLDGENYYDWKLADNAAAGGKVFGDRDYTYISFPEEVSGAEALLTACDSKNVNAQLADFTAGEKIDVYLFLDVRLGQNNAIPSWTNDWTKTEMTALTSNDVTFDVYKKTFEKDELVELGTNGMNGNVVNYTVFVKEAAPDAPQPTLWGDADCDGSVRINDAVLVLQSIASPDKYGLTGSEASHITEIGVLNADVYQNGGGITSMDALSIQKHCMNSSFVLPES